MNSRFMGSSVILSLAPRLLFLFLGSYGRVLVSGVRHCWMVSRRIGPVFFNTLVSFHIKLSLFLRTSLKISLDFRWLSGQFTKILWYRTIVGLLYKPTSKGLQRTECKLVAFEPILLKVHFTTLYGLAIGP